MRVKTVRRKGKLKPKEKGEPMSYKKIPKPPTPSLKQVRGLYQCWLRAPKFILRLEAQELRMYLSEDGGLTKERKEAKKFAHGFDDPEVKTKYWSERLGLKFKTENT